MLRAQGLICPASATILTTTTANPGTGWVAIGNANATAPANLACKEITVVNLTGQTLKFAYATAGEVTPLGETMEIPTASQFTFRGLSRNTQLLVKRSDEGAQVTFSAMAEGV